MSIFWDEFHQIDTNFCKQIGKEEQQATEIPKPAACLLSVSDRLILCRCRILCYPFVSKHTYGGNRGAQNPYTKTKSINSNDFEQRHCKKFIDFLKIPYTIPQKWCI
ncbi:MAG: hypothetical protein II101_07515, partial [Ruminococcus sp.]|nr:hypothetical protein [Ruminococcus sp.]